MGVGIGENFGRCLNRENTRESEHEYSRFEAFAMNEGKCRERSSIESEHRLGWFLRRKLLKIRTWNSAIWLYSTYMIEAKFYFNFFFSVIFFYFSPLSLLFLFELLSPLFHFPGAIAPKVLDLYGTDTRGSKSLPCNPPPSDILYKSQQTYLLLNGSFREFKTEHLVQRHNSVILVQR